MNTQVWIIAPDGTMRPGHYRVRLAKGATLVPAVLAEIAPPCDEDGEPMYEYVYTLFVNGQKRCPFTEFPGGLSGEPVDETSIRYMDAVRDWAVQHAPAEPEANPFERVNLRAIAPIF